MSSTEPDQDITPALGAALAASVAGVPIRVCGWCEEAHPEHISIEWFPGRLHFCSDACYGEWGESA